ncbi:MAG TPA: hypothetical protein VKS22_11685 [Candidatus Binataceae bacterium]|nr:hypothetical protein [Candidatus Binataceae bacterium]
MNALTERTAATAPRAASWVVPNRSQDFLRSLLAHRWLAGSIAVGVALAGLIVALLYGHATYVAEAIIRVAPSSSVPLSGAQDSYASEESYRDFAQQQVFEIGGYASISQALAGLGAKRDLWQEPHETDRHAAERLMSSIKVELIPDSYFISVSLEDTNPQGLAEIVNAVVNTYLSREARQELNGADTGVQMLNSRKGELQQQMAGDQEQLNQLAQSLQIATFESSLANPYDKLLADENTALARAHRAALASEARVAALESSQEHIKALEIDSKAQELLTNDTETATAKQQLMQQREAASVELEGLGRNHPARPALAQKIASIDEELKKLDQASLAKIRSSVQASEGDKSGVTLSQAKANLDQARRTEEGIQKDLDGLRANAAAFGVKYAQAVAVHDKIERERKELQDVADQASLLRLQSRAPGFVSLESAAMQPDLPLKGRRRKIFILFTFIALALAVGVPTGLDLIDPRIRAAAELEGILGFPPLGAVQLGGGRMGREGLRRVALGILRERRTSGVRAYVMTPVQEGAGTTTLALALAQELSDLGVRAATIESAPIPADQQLVDGSDERRKLRDGARVVRPTGDMTRHIARTGSLEGNRHALVTAAEEAPGRFTICHHSGSGGLALECVKESVERAMQTHDIVLLDAPPLLTSADAVLLMQMPAGAILVVRGGRDEVRDVLAAAREIERLAPPVVGAVLNTFFPNGETDQLPPSAVGWLPV